MRTLVLSIILTGLLTACATNALSIDRPRPSQVTGYVVSDAQMQELAVLWERYEMPNPPEHAPVVVVTEPGETWATGVKLPPDRSVWFLVRAGSRNKNPRLFNGVHEIEEHKAAVELVDAANIDPADVNFDPWYDRDTVFRYSRAFAMGIHCWKRGYKETGRTLVVRNIGRNMRTTRDCVYQPNGNTARETLGSVIWGYWYNELFQRNSDRKAIHERLKNAIQDFECLRPQEDEYARSQFVDLLAELSASLAPSTAPAGSIESQIDALTEVSIKLFSGTLNWIPGSWDENKPLPGLLLNLLLKGFDAVPTLINYINDQRLTRSVSTPFINGSTSRVSIGDLALLILQAIANRNVSQPALNTETGLYERAERKLRQWWAGTERTDEATYLLGCLNRRPEPDIFSAEGSIAAWSLLLAHKYPERFAQFYSQSINGPDPSYCLSEAVLSSQLSRDRKIALLLEGADCPHFHHRFEAMRQLNTLDAARVDELVIQRLSSLDSKLDRTKRYTSNAVEYARLVLASENVRVWNTLIEFARRAEADLRIRILAQFARPLESTPQVERSIRFLSQFLRDTTVRELKKKDIESDPAKQWESIEIGQFAALRIGAALELDTLLEPGCEASVLDEFRESVIVRLTEKGIEVR